MKLMMNMMLWLVLGTACATRPQQLQVNKESHSLELQSSADERSALHQFSDKGAVAQAEKHLTNKLRNNVRDVPAWLNLAEVQFARGKYRKAEESCRNAIRLDVKNRDARKILARIAMRKNNDDMALIILNGLDGERSKDPDVLNMLGQIAIHRGQNAQSLALFKRALKFNPNHVATRMNLGVMYLEYAQLKEAEAEFESVLKINPGHLDARLHMAVVKASQGDLATAEDIYDEVLSIQPKNPLALYNMALVHRANGDHEQAMTHLKEYMGTSYAKTHDSKRVMTMMAEIRRDQNETGEPVTDAEIQNLAAELKTPQEQQAPGPVTAEVAPEQVEAEEVESQDQEIDALEQDLIQ